MQRSIYAEFAAEDADYENQDLSGFNGPPPSTRPDARDYLTPQDLAQWRWANVDNLDAFLREVYEYYLGHGFFSVALSRVLQMATVLFVVVFASYLYSCIDYTRLYGARTLTDIRRPQCIAHMSWVHRLLLWVFGILWVLKLFQYASSLRRLWELHDFYKYMLEIEESELQTISWPHVVDRLARLPASNLATAGGALDAHSIVNRIMRQENYMIGLYNKSVLDLSIELPLQGRQQFLTKTLEWSIDMCLADYIFNERGVVRPAVLQEQRRDEVAAGLRRRFQFAALLSIALAPFAAFYTALYYFFRYFNDYRSDPKNLGARQYTPLAEWKFRELNELYHLFRRRVSRSYEPAQYYISLFPREKTEQVMRFAIFVCSSFAAVLGVLSVYDPEFLKVELFPEQSVLFWLTTLGLAIAVARATLASPQDQAAYEPERALRAVAEYTHYLPEEWEDRLHSERVKLEFTGLYDMKLKVILRELLSILLNPLILGVKLAANSETIVDYFREFSTDDGSCGGPVCSLARFDADPDAVKARSDALDQYYASQDGKMLKSYLNFVGVYGPARDEPRDLDASVMDTYDRIAGPLAAVPEESDDDRVRDGVLGLLNNLYHK